VRAALVTAFLFGSMLSSAAAAPVTVEQELNAAGAAVGLPGDPPDAVPNLPVAGPKQPQVGSVDQDLVREPAPQPRAPKSEPSGAPGPVTSPPDPRAVGREAVAGATTRARSPDTAAVAESSGPGPGPLVQAGPRAGTPGPTVGSIRAAMPAPLQEWLAYLWPAIALGPVGGALMAQAATLAPALLPKEVATAVRSSRPADDRFGTGPPTAQSASPGPASFLSPHRVGMSFLVAVITALMALVGVVAFARLAVGEDFFSLRWLR
jgi:hypothetical protein